MRFLLSAIFIGSTFGSSAPARLRTLFESVKEFAQETGSSPSNEQAELIMDSAVKFAKSEGTELDNFVNVLQTVCQGGIGKCNLDDLSWKAIDRLYQSKTTASSIVSNINAAPAPKAEPRPEVSKTISSSAIVAPKAEPKPAEISTSSVVAPPKILEEISGLKRQGPSSSEVVEKKSRTSEPDLLRHLIQTKLDGHQRNKRFHVTRTDGLRYLNYIHYKMAVEGNYEALLDNLEMLEDIRSFIIADLFEEAHDRLNDRSYRMSREREEKLRELERETERDWNKPVNKEIIVGMLNKFCGSEAQLLKSPYGSVEIWSNRMVDFAEKGDYKSLNYYIKFFDAAQTSHTKMRSLFEASYLALKKL